MKKAIRIPNQEKFQDNFFLRIMSKNIEMDSLIVKRREDYLKKKGIKKS